MLNFCSKLNDKNKVTMANGNDIYNDILKIGKLINDLGTNKEKDLTEWSHKKDGTFKLNKTEIDIINSINDETLEKFVSTLLKRIIILIL